MPEWRNIVEMRIAALHLAPAAARDLAEELAQHLEDRFRELRSGGAAEEEARRIALAELADMEAMRTFERRYRPQPEAPSGTQGARAGFVDSLRKDLAFAVRTMRRSPVFVLTVVLTLGLGIGANTTVFTIIDTLLLNPLPVPDSGRLAAVVAVPSGVTAASQAALPLSWLNLKDYREGNRVFTSLAGFTGPRVLTMQENGAPDRIFAELVTGNYFSALGLRPAAGRFFLPEEDGVPGAHPVAVMNYATWQTRFGGAPDAVGRTLRLNNVDFTVIGVAPPRFIGINALFGPNLWIPAAMAEQLLPNQMQGILSDRGKAVFTGIGRLKPGVNRSQAQANIATIAAALQHQYPEADSGHAAAVRPMIDIMFGSAASGSSPVVFASLVLVVVVGVVLLIACSNVANLLLARSAARRHELAVRLAMGANRPRLVRQLLSESLVLGLLGGVAGLFIGYSGIRAVWTFLPSDVNTNFVTPRMDPLILLFTLAAALATGFAFGILPAWRASRVDPADSLKEEGRNVGRTRRRITFANSLLVGQVAFSFLLLVLASLFLRSIGRAYQIDPGFQTGHLVVLLTSPGQAGYDQARSKAFYKDVRTQVSALPGVASVSWASNLPLWGRTAAGLEIEGRAARSRADTLTTVVNTVDLDYFETAGTAIREGREFTESDRAGSIPVAIVNEKLAHDFWPRQSALGKRIRLPGETRMRQIVGVARTADYTSLNESPQFCVYLPLAQNYSDSMTLYVRTRGDPARLLQGIERVVSVSGPGIVARDIRTGQNIVRDGLFGARVGVTMLAVFGLLALALASLGLYGLMAYSVEQRTREIGVRMALGAAKTSVIGLILKQGMSLVAAGVLLGFLASLAAGRLLARALYGVTAGDPISVGGAALVLLVVALAACFLPARRASRLDPLAALREG